MAINSTSGAASTIQITSPAKNNGTISAATATSVTLPDSITATNNGNLMASPVLTGRLIRMTSGGASGEVRYIVSDNGTTLATVHEDWLVTPSSGDSYEISYIVEDAATVAGLGVINKRVSDYALSKEFEVQSGGFFALLNGASFEGDNQSSTTKSEMRILSGGRWHIGYVANGVTVSGGALFSTMTVAGDISFDNQSGGVFEAYDMLFMSVNDTFVNMNGTTVIQGSKMFSLHNGSDWTGPITFTDAKIEGLGNSTDVLEIDSSITCNSLILISTNGLSTTDNTTTETINLSNVTFVGPARYILIHENKTVNLIDPVGFVPITTDQTDLDFAGTIRNGEINEKYSLKLTIQDPTGTVLTNSRVFMYENTQTDSLVLDLSADGSGEVDDSWVYRNFVDNADTSVTSTTYGGHALRVFDYGKFPFIAAQTANEKNNGIVTLIDDGAITQPVQATAITNGSGITVTRHATGETDTRAMKVLNYDGGTGSVPTIGETMTQGSATGVVVEYLGDAVSGTLVLDTWNGTEFTDNQTITGGASTFSATTDLIGGTSFYEEYTWLVDCNSLALTTVYDYLAARMAEGTLQAIFDQVHEWGRDEQSQLIYSTSGGYTTERNVALTEGVWLANRGTGDIAHMTADDGTTFTPPASFSFTYASLKSGTEVRLYQDSDDSELAGTESVVGTQQGSGSDGSMTAASTTFTNSTSYTFTSNDVGRMLRITSGSNADFYLIQQFVDGNNVKVTPSFPATDSTVSFTVNDNDGSFAYNYIYGGSDIDAYAMIVHKLYEIERSESVVLSNSNQSIPINQRFDRNFKNP